LPFTAFLSWSAQLFTSRIRERAASEAIPVAPTEELRVLVERSQEAGALPEADATLLEGVLEFTEMSVRAVMTPRTEIAAIPVTATIDEAMAVVEEHGFSRYPAYEGSVDNIVGLILAKDLIRALRAGAGGGAAAHAAEPMRSIVRAVHFVPATLEVERVLADFKRWGEHLAIVLDEYGGTAGLVTMEDLLEEIVGEIRDEYDEPEPALGTPRSGEILVPGDTSISELNDRLGLSVPERDFATIGGFVFGSLGRVPRIGDRVSAGGATFTVRAVDGRRAETLAVKLGAEQ
ncbi:MAG TPA: hemolysin family protein, partial [Gemmatimonadaceae bacterium]|nr:hemolysin family protein [Gemmatimonadaceae bacterium]